MNSDLPEYDNGIVDACIGVIKFILDGLEDDQRANVLEALHLKEA